MANRRYKGDDMVQGVGKDEHFHRRCPIVKSGEDQNRLLTFKEDIYASAEDIPPDGSEDPSMCSQASHAALTHNIYSRALHRCPQTTYVHNQSDGCSTIALHPAVERQWC